jgi:hypothetical protein
MFSIAHSFFGLDNNPRPDHCVEVFLNSVITHADCNPGDIALIQITGRDLVDCFHIHKDSVNETATEHIRAVLNTEEFVALGKQRLTLNEYKTLKDAVDGLLATFGAPP